MSQCVPSCDTATPKLSVRSFSNNSGPDVPILNYEVAELTWENGQLAMHGLGPPRVPSKPVLSHSPSKYTTWEKPRASGTLESIVNQATRLPCPLPKLPFDNSLPRPDDLVPWFDHHHSRASAAASSATMTMDALVPCSNRTERSSYVIDSSVPGGMGTGVVGSCSVSTGKRDEELGVKRARAGPVENAPEWSSKNQSGSGGTFGGESEHVSLENSERDVCVGFTSTSFGGSHDYASSGKPPKTVTVDENDSVCHSTPQRGAGEEEDKKKGSGKSSVSTKRSRAAAIHNQSERKRRDKINQRMKTLQKLVPNSSKTDKASMLDEVIEYLKQLQAQVHMMSRINMQPIMLPMALQQQLQMSMMAPMSMGMGMGMGMGVMDINNIARPNIPSIPPAVLHPTAFMPMAASWDSGNASSDRLQPTSTTMMPDPLSAFLACQPQPMTMDAYSRMAALYHQLQQHPTAASSNN